ncbi:hypothetical protein M0R45_007853 [Rubus argutus]|uniref:Uncharacterized protein n=1 Tax=Rubus argutus TaxID=59490 RepID=A0AAW1XZV1_RUBAR
MRRTGHGEIDGRAASIVRAGFFLSLLFLALGLFWFRAWFFMVAEGRRTATRLGLDDTVWAVGIDGGAWATWIGSPAVEKFVSVVVKGITVEWVIEGAADRFGVCD